MALISLRIPDEVAAEFSVLAATQGGKSALLRRLIADALAARAPRILALPVGRPEKVTVRFRESEIRQLADVSHQRGMTRTGWIVALVRSRLGSPVQHSPDEHAALRAIVRELNGSVVTSTRSRAPQTPVCCRAWRLSPICPPFKRPSWSSKESWRNCVMPYTATRIIGMDGDEPALTAADRASLRSSTDLVRLGNA